MKSDPAADTVRVEEGAPHSEQCNSVACPCYRDGRQEVGACARMLARRDARIDKLQRALTWARYHLEHQEHGVDLCFACFLEGEIDKILDGSLSGEGSLPVSPPAGTLIPAEQPGGMTWAEVKDFLDHIRTTCLDERQALKLEVRHLRAQVVRLQREMAEHMEGRQ